MEEPCKSEKMKLAASDKESHPNKSGRGICPDFLVEKTQNEI